MVSTDSGGNSSDMAQGNSNTRADWLKKDTKAFAMLKLLVEDAQLVLVLPVATFHDTWEQLVSR